MTHMQTRHILRHTSTAHPVTSDLQWQYVHFDIVTNNPKTNCWQNWDTNEEGSNYRFYFIKTTPQTAETLDTQMPI